MKWTRKEPKLGDRRVVKRFLLLPRELGGEVRWLERAEIVQEYNFASQPNYSSTPAFEWRDERFAP